MPTIKTYEFLISLTKIVISNQINYLSVIIGLSFLIPVWDLFSTFFQIYQFYGKNSLKQFNLELRYEKHKIDE